MWGTHRHRKHGPHHRRFIPTHVGNTYCGACPLGIRPVHPHACGEHIYYVDFWHFLRGSSPRMWGTPYMIMYQPAIGRFIPTHVGNTSCIGSPSFWDSVHPHACGEHDRNHEGGGEGHRFIPTHVGNTLLRWPLTAWVAVHPHACGEHTWAQGYTGKRSGSSPRMWGTHMGTRVYGEKERFIPTHVGNTAVAKAISDVLVVHPHACGEHSWASPLATIRTGSSPRMWGTLYQGYGERDCKRFIPTHVGNTLSPMIISAMRAVHPHACGEHPKPCASSIREHGSSPRMWGTLQDGESHE